jgi:hypothetical protein
LSASVAAIDCLNPSAIGRPLTASGSVSSRSRVPFSGTGANAELSALTCSGCASGVVPLTRWPVAVALGSRTVSSADEAVEVAVAARLAS